MKEMQDPYNWKFPQKNDTMYLSKISQSYATSKAFIKQSSTMTTQGIEGATPILKSYQFVNKPQFSNRNHDIQHSSSKPLTKQFNCQSFQLFTDDIPGTKPIKKFKTTRQPSNPLEPVYVLSKVQPVEPIIPKFIRDSIQVQDIDGAKPKIDFYMRLQRQGKVRYKAQIEGTKSKQQRIVHNNFFLNPKDINQEGQWKTKRSINPLQPQQIHFNRYYLNGQKLDLIQGSKPKKTYISNTKANYQLNTQGIQGAKANHIYQKFQKYKARQINKTNDIPGTEVNSKIRGLVTKRQTNPLKPNYQYIGFKQQVKGSRPLSAVQRLDKFVK